jgi:hypothetical protein
MAYRNKEDKLKYDRKYNEDNKDKRAKIKVQMRKRNSIYVYREKQKRECSICGESRAICLEFHHRDPTEKTQQISIMVNSQASIERIQEEIDKCDVLCANCHRVETAKQQNWYWYIDEEF